jgi:hypothetical protein
LLIATFVPQLELNKAFTDDRCDPWHNHLAVPLLLAGIVLG